MVSEKIASVEFDLEFVGSFSHLTRSPCCCSAQLKASRFFELVSDCHA